MCVCVCAWGGYTRPNSHLHPLLSLLVPQTAGGDHRARRCTFTCNGTHKRTGDVSFRMYTVYSLVSTGLLRSFARVRLDWRRHQARWCVLQVLMPLLYVKLTTDDLCRGHKQSRKLLVRELRSLPQGGGGVASLNRVYFAAGTVGFQSVY